jgi:hypothetical protein
MYTPLTAPVPDLRLPETCIDYPVISFFRAIIQPYARALRFREPVLLHSERFISAWNDFLRKKTRLIVGFRHAYGDDPQLMAYTLHHVLPEAAKKNGTPFRKITHAHFLYASEVPLWSGKFVRWLLPKSGAIPVNHVHLDARGMTRIRKILAEGEFPLALAPEGHVTYTSETVGELETGTARFGFWCMDDLESLGRFEPVVFLSVSVHYRYTPKALKTLSRFVTKMEKECGILFSPETRDASVASSLQEIALRLSGTGKAILAHLKSFYSELSRTNCGDCQSDILESTVQAAERILALEASGSVMERIYRIRSVAWDRIYRSDIDGMSALGKNLAGRETGEAWYAMRHLDTAELLFHVDLSAVPPEAPLETLIEIANNFYDILERQKGGTVRNRANIFDKYPVIIPGEPLVLNDFRQLYATDKKGALQKATDEMRIRFENCIKEYRNEYR